MRNPMGGRFIFLCLACVALASAAETQENPANEIVKLVNANRTASKLPKLKNSPGLGCMALQYLSQCIGKCSINDTLSCQPPEVDITEVYAPNCGVELPTIGTISGHLQGCHWGYLNPEEALSSILHKNKKSVSLLQSKDQTGIGVGFKSLKGEASYWCVLLSNVTSKSSFVLEAGGKGIQQKNGCFSGADEPCSSGNQIAFSGLGYFKLVVCILFSLFSTWTVNLL